MLYDKLSLELTYIIIIFKCSLGWSKLLKNMNILTGFVPCTNTPRNLNNVYVQLDTIIQLENGSLQQYHLVQKEKHNFVPFASSDPKQETYRLW